MTGVRFDIVVSGAMLVAVWPPMGASAQSNLRDRLAAAIESVQSNCAEDIDSYCAKVLPGEGRIILCMQAHEDHLSRGCQITLYSASRRLEGALHRVEKIADACWTDIEAQCADTEKIGQCVVQKRALLSDPCQTAVATVRKSLEGLPILMGMPAYSADGRVLGNIVDIVRGPDGNVQAVNVEVGRFLGLGSRVVTIDARDMEPLADRMNLHLTGDAIQSLPETKR
jgi:Golgi apparatus protein 1